MSNIATNIAQSRRLLELGLDPKTADMVWVRYAAGGYRLEVLHRELFERIKETDIPAWSFSALLEVMPSDLYYQHTVVHIEKDYYSCIRNIHDPEQEDGPYGVRATFGDTAVNAAYEMVCWLLEQGIIEKGGEV